MRDVTEDSLSRLSYLMWDSLSRLSSYNPSAILRAINPYASPFG